MQLPSNVCWLREVEMSRQLSDEDREYLRQSVADLSDICPCQLRRINADFNAAHERAEQIRLGLSAALD